MSDWVNWSQYAEQATPEVQRMAQERQQAAQNQQAAMVSGVEALRQQSRARGGATPVTQLGGYGQLMGQQQQALQQQAQQQGSAGSWESQVAGGGFAENPWAQLSSRLQDVQAEAVGQKTKQAADVAEQQRKAAENAALRQTAEQNKTAREKQRADTDRMRQFQEFERQKAGGFYWGGLNPFDFHGHAMRQTAEAVGLPTEYQNTWDPSIQKRVQGAYDWWTQNATPEEKAEFEKFMGKTTKGGA